MTLNKAQARVVPPQHIKGQGRPLRSSAPQKTSKSFSSTSPASPAINSTMNTSAAQSNNAAPQVIMGGIPIPEVDLPGLNPRDGFTLYFQDQLAKDKALLEKWKKNRHIVEEELEEKYKKLPPEKKDIYENMVVMPPGWA